MGHRLFDQHMFAGIYSGQRNRRMRIWRCGDNYQVYIGSLHGCQRLGHGFSAVSPRHFFGPHLVDIGHDHQLQTRRLVGSLGAWFADSTSPYERHPE
jgi:hypothetical protein